MSQHVTSGYGQHTTVLLNIPHLSLAFLSVGDAKVLMAVFPSWPFSVNIPPTHRHTHTLLPCISLTGEDLLLESAAYLPKHRHFSSVQETQAIQEALGRNYAGQPSISIAENRA